MSKPRRWPLYLIIAVIALTLYNILPTLFFYTKPLKSPINEKRAMAVAKDLTARVNSLEEESKEWLASFCDLLSVKPKEIFLQQDRPQLISVQCPTLEEANRLRKFLPRAGALIPFVPAQLSLHNPDETTNKTVVVERKIPVHFNASAPQQYTQFSYKFNSSHEPTPLYRALIEDRAMQVAIAIAGPSEHAAMVQALITHSSKEEMLELATELSQAITSFVKAYPENSPIATRFFSSFTSIEGANTASTTSELIGALDKIKGSLRTEKESLLNSSDLPKAIRDQRLSELSHKEELLGSAINVIKRNQKHFAQGQAPQTLASIDALLSKADPSSTQRISLAGYNPFIEALEIDWKLQKIILQPYPEVIKLRQSLSEHPSSTAASDLADALIYNNLANIGRTSQEEISPKGNLFEISLSDLEHSQSFLALSLGSIAKAQLAELKSTLSNIWQPEHPDLTHSAFPIYDEEIFKELSKKDQQFGLVLYAPSLTKAAPHKGFRGNSLYIIARGLGKILERAEQNTTSHTSHLLEKDIHSLSQIMQRNGFVRHTASASYFGPEFQNDMVFECPNYYQNVLGATRENFQVHGSRRYAILEFTNVEQRVLTENAIDNQIHEDILKARDDYTAARLGSRGASRFDVPKPTQSALWSNVKLSALKYFRGDDRKVLKWGLDLSGGKTVQIELKGEDHKVITDPQDIKQGINELYKRVNKMGVSEVSIRQEGHFITLDFPGSQNLSAAELVKASKMFFHVVNEQFSSHNPSLRQAVGQFLQDVWNEAVVTNRKTSLDINRIAFRHLYGDSPLDAARPLSDAASLLYNQGLRLANPDEDFASHGFDTALSSIALFRGEDFTDWQGQTNPLLIVFNNFAIEGSDLENIHASYDPSKGNFLSFGVQGSHVGKGGVKSDPSESLYAWTSLYSKERIAGTPLEAYSQGRGWRMAVILNGSIISAPTLDSPLKDSAMISGSFTQREISQLETDLKAGSLSFTPHIVSEQNVSPELGAKEREHGIIATVLSLVCVVSMMIGYYRFGGFIASLAVLFNLLIMWATLQNLGAALTLPGIAGVILTLAMAVDANVLVFERVREEFKVTGQIAQAIHAGYRKAFSAILDSNVTTIIAALILLQFDSGPIKALAVMLLIGIVSSLFTALFMTRFFFTQWVKNPKNTALHMLNWFKSKNFDFLKHTKKTVIFASVVILVGSAVLLKERHTLFGMDFTGGYALNIELQPNSSGGYRHLVEEALLKKGISSQEVQVRELSPENRVRVLLSYNLKERGKPFYGMPLENNLKDPLYAYELNPKIVWVVDSLQAAGLKIEASSLTHLDTHWTEMSGQMSDTMRNSAVIGLVIALLCILVYITLRFEFKYAISATICLAHDVLFSLAALALLHACKIPVQIDLNTVAALMTIVGYSLNDTIIIFDRIREEVKLMRKAPLAQLINHALNVTLGRTLMTSGTTLFVLIPLILLGGSTLFGFALVLCIGVIFGTLSSLFIAAPLMKYFHDRDARKEESVLLNVQSRAKDEIR